MHATDERAGEPLTTLPDVTAVWRGLLRPFLQEGRKAVAGETLTHLGAILSELGNPAEGARMADLGWAFLREVGRAPLAAPSAGALSDEIAELLSATLAAANDECEELREKLTAAERLTTQLAAALAGGKAPP